MTIHGDLWVDYIPGEELFFGHFREGILYNVFEDISGNRYVVDDEGKRWYSDVL